MIKTEEKRLKLKFQNIQNQEKFLGFIWRIL